MKTIGCLVPIIIFLYINMLYWDEETIFSFSFQEFYNFIAVCFGIGMGIIIVIIIIKLPGWFLCNLKNYIRDNPYESMEDMSFKDTLIYSLIFIFSATYIISIWKWFSIDHELFWNGFKELLWALCPIANIFYSIDTWITLLIFIKNSIHGL